MSKSSSLLLMSALQIGLLVGSAALYAETIPGGTQIAIHLKKDLEREVGRKQTFSADLAQPIFVRGRLAIPLGTRVEGEVRGSKKTIFLSPQKLILPDGRKLDFNATVKGVSFKTLTADSKEGTIESKGGHKGEVIQQAGEIGSQGAIIGAISTGTMSGAGIGAAAGVAAVIIGRAIVGHGKATQIPAGSEITLSLDKPIDVPDDIADIKQPEMKVDNRTDERPTLRRAEAPADAEAK
jgi:hypothetical protein